MNRWAFRFIMFFVLILFTQPHMRFPFLIPFHLGDLCMLGALGCHFLGCSSTKKPFIHWGPATKLCVSLVVLALLTHYWNPHQKNPNWNTEIDGILKVSLIIILLEAQIDSVYKAAAVLGSLAAGTLWWVKGGVRLASSGATLTGDRLMGVNVTIIHNPNYFAYLMVLMIPLYFYFYTTHKHSKLKFIFLGMMGAGAFIALSTGSRSGFLCLIIACAGMLPKILKGHKEIVTYALVGGFLGIGALGAGNIERFKSITNTINKIFDPEAYEVPESKMAKLDDMSGISRWTKAKDTFTMIMRYPILGVGTNPKAYTHEGLHRAKGKVHNEWLMAGRQMGIPGLIIYYLLIYLPVKYGWNTYKYCKESWPEVAMLGWIICVMVAVIFVGGMFSPSAFNYPHMLLFVTSAGLWTHVKNMGLAPRDA